MTSEEALEIVRQAAKRSTEKVGPNGSAFSFAKAMFSDADYRAFMALQSSDKAIRDRVLAGRAAERKISEVLKVVGEVLLRILETMSFIVLFSCLYGT